MADCLVTWCFSNWEVLTRTESPSKFTSSRLGSLTSSNDASQLEPLRQVRNQVASSRAHEPLSAEGSHLRHGQIDRGNSTQRLLRSTVPPASREAGCVLRCFGRAYERVQAYITLISCNAAPGYPSSHSDAQEHRPSGIAAALLQWERCLPRSSCMGCNTVERVEAQARTDRGRSSGPEWTSSLRL